MIKTLNQPVLVGRNSFNSSVLAGVEPQWGVNGYNCENANKKARFLRALVVTSAGPLVLRPRCMRVVVVNTCRPGPAQVRGPGAGLPGERVAGLQRQPLRRATMPPPCQQPRTHG